MRLGKEIRVPGRRPGKKWEVIELVLKVVGNYITKLQFVYRVYALQINVHIDMAIKQKGQMIYKEYCRSEVDDGDCRNKNITSDVCITD